MLMRLLFIALFLHAVPALAIQVVHGSYSGDGLDNKDITVSPSCQPVAVFVNRDSATRDMFARFSSMGSNVSKVVTNTSAEVTDAIKVLNSNGFRLGTNVNTNASGVTHYYTAICDNGANDVAVGSYAGSGAATTAISFASATFTPELCLILHSSTALNAWRGAASHSGDSASSMNTSTADAADRIESFTAGGFSVGSLMHLNATTYYYLCLKASASGVATGSYTGDTNDTRDISTGFQPEFVGIKGNSTTNQLAYRHGSNSGDASYCDVGAATTNIIEAFEATNFQVGTSTCANENTVTMRWFALADVGRRVVAPLFR